MTSVSKRRVQLVAASFVGASLSAALLATFAGEASTTRDVTPTSSLGSEQCTGGSDVSRFICRNGWIAFGRHASR